MYRDYIDVRFRQHVKGIVFKPLGFVMPTFVLIFKEYFLKTGFILR